MEVSGNQNTWFAVVNIFAASKKAGKLWREAEKTLRRDQIPFTSRRTGNNGNAMHLTCAACEEGYRKFIAVGGDGTIHDVLEGIMFFIESSNLVGGSVSLADFTFAVIPVGSGNDWIKTTGVPKDVAKSASLFRDGRISKQDVVKVTLLDCQALPEEKMLRKAFMANIGGVGLDARVCEKVNKEKMRGKRGKRLYISALLYHIIHRVPAFAKVICDGRTVFEGSYLSMSLGIGKYSGGGMRQTPEAVMDDGLLDLTIIPDLPLLKIAKEAPKLFSDKFWTVPELVTARARTITVVPHETSSVSPQGAAHHSGAPASALSRPVVGDLVEVDGEVIGRAPVKFEILPDQLNILTV